MSDSEKLRKTYGTIALALSFFIFALAICDIGAMFIFPDPFAISLCGLVPLFLFIFSGIFASVAFDIYTGINRKEINNSDSAKLLKINGIIALVSAFVFLALAISTIWIFFIFIQASQQLLPVFIILFFVFIAFFIGFARVACNKFMKIEKIVK